jgi:hypothetical protein
MTHDAPIAALSNGTPVYLRDGHFYCWRFGEKFWVHESAAQVEGKWAMYGSQGGYWMLRRVDGAKLNALVAAGDPRKMT